MSPFSRDYLRAQEIFMGFVAETIRSKLEATFAPDELVILDESHLHAGHHGHTGRDETHFAVAMKASAFAGKSRVERQRMVYEVLADELAGQVHALRLSLNAPE
jgi:BolA family transcriptional regulator, general stress-responsive regulator